MSISSNFTCANLTCGKLTGMFRRRGLCHKCYLILTIRNMHKPQRRGPLPDSKRINDLYELFLKGIADREIATITGRTIVAVIKHRQRFNLVVSSARQGLHRRKKLTCLQN